VWKDAAAKLVISIAGRVHLSATFSIVGCAFIVNYLEVTKKGAVSRICAGQLSDEHVGESDFGILLFDTEAHFSRLESVGR
jgi:hypothetical protein